MYILRLCIAGDSGVGKTSLLVRFNEDTFSNHQKSTIGYDFKAKEVVIPALPLSSSSSVAEGKMGDLPDAGDHVKLQIWDTAGQERFRSMAASYYAKARGVVLTFDVCQRESFDSLSSWISDVLRAAPSGCIIVLCANKVDYDENSWQVRREEFTALATQRGYPLVEASGKTGKNVQDMFIKLSRLILAAQRGELEQISDVDPATGTIAGGVKKSGKEKQNIVLLDTPFDDTTSAKKKSSSWSSC